MSEESRTIEERLKEIDRLEFFISDWLRENEFAHSDLQRLADIARKAVAGEKQ